MSKAEDAIRKGAAAKSLLESTDFNLALDTVRLNAFQGWANSAPAEGEKREQNYYLLQAVDRLKENLTALVENAKLEEHKIERNQPKPGDENV